MNRLYNLCDDNKEPEWSRYTRLEVSGSKRHNGETEAMVFAHDAEFFTVYGRLPSFEVEPITDCADATLLLAVAAELGYRSRLEVFLHPTLFDTQPAAEFNRRVPATVHTDDGNIVVAFDATPFFETASDDLIRELIEDDFAGGYGADVVAQELADETNELGRMFWYLEHTNEQRDEPIGYEVSVDAASAKRWLELYKPHLLEQGHPEGRDTMNRTNELLLAAARRAEGLMNPIDGDFLREHKVSSDELGELSNAVSVALAAYAKSDDIDPDLRSQIVVVGVSVLSNVPEKLIRHALDMLRLTQSKKKLRRAS